MKAVVAYDSYFGNTKAVAEAIVDELKVEGHEAELTSVRDRNAARAQGDILFVGSPVRFGAVSRRAKRYVKKLNEDAWRDKPIAVFTTTLMLPDDATDAQIRDQDRYDRGAGLKLCDLAKSKGLNSVESPLWVEVESVKGPLVETGVEKTHQFTHDVLHSLTGVASG